MFLYSNSTVQYLCKANWSVLLFYFSNILVILKKTYTTVVLHWGAMSCPYCLAYE